MNKSGESLSPNQLCVTDFLELALVDFVLMDAFERRSSQERAACLAWIAAGRGALEETARVSEMLDCLEYGSPLPGVALADVVRASILK